MTNKVARPAPGISHLSLGICHFRGVADSAETLPGRYVGRDLWRLPCYSPVPDHASRTSRGVPPAPGVGFPCCNGLLLRRARRRFRLSGGSLPVWTHPIRDGAQCPPLEPPGGRHVFSPLLALRTFQVRPALAVSTHLHPLRFSRRNHPRI